MLNNYQYRDESDLYADHIPAVYPTCGQCGGNMGIAGCCERAAVGYPDVNLETDADAIARHARSLDNFGQYDVLADMDDYWTWVREGEEYIADYVPDDEPEYAVDYGFYGEEL